MNRVLYGSRSTEQDRVAELIDRIVHSYTTPVSNFVITAAIDHNKIDSRPIQTGAESLVYMVANLASSLYCLGRQLNKFFVFFVSW